MANPLADGEPARLVVVGESTQVPLLDWIFAFGPMMPLAAAAIVAWTSSGSMRGDAIDLEILWGVGILLFLSGVRRGLSFRTEGGPTLAQISTMLALFGIGIWALVAWRVGAHAVAVVAIMVGYGIILVFDPIAARRGEAPLYFARLRPLQIPIALVSLAAVLARVIIL